MQKAPRTALASVIAVSLLRASTALAHIDLLEPEARAHGTAARGDTDIDVNSSLKSGPCGQVMSGRTTRVATYAPGQVITVRVREENAHVSYLRVSIDLDGEDFPIRSQVPLAPETQEQASAAEVALGGQGLLAVVRENNDTPGFVHEIEVTLPEQSCTNCTLQVIQFMYDDPSAPYYFQCADLRITDAGGPVVDAGTGSGTSTGPAPAYGAGGFSGTIPAEPRDPSPAQATGAAGSAAGGAAAAASPGAAAEAMSAGGSAAATPSAPAPASAVVVSAEDDGGCSLSHGAGSAGGGSHSPRSLPTLTLALWAAALCIARRRR